MHNKEVVRVASYYSHSLLTSNSQYIDDDGYPSILKSLTIHVTGNGTCNFKFDDIDDSKKGGKE